MIGGEAGAKQLNYDQRLTPARPDLAAEHLSDRVQAEAFVPGEPHAGLRAFVDVRRAPPTKPRPTRRRCIGETLIVYEEKNGWSWASSIATAMSAMSSRRADGPHRQAEPSRARRHTLVYPGRTSNRRRSTPCRSAPRSYGRRADRRGLAKPARRLLFSAISRRTPAPDRFRRARGNFLHTPYLWGGKTDSGSTVRAWSS